MCAKESEAQGVSKALLGFDKRKRLLDGDRQAWVFFLGIRGCTVERSFSLMEIRKSSTFAAPSTHFLQRRGIISPSSHRKRYLRTAHLPCGLFDRSAFQFRAQVGSGLATRRRCERNPWSNKVPSTPTK